MCTYECVRASGSYFKNIMVTKITIFSLWNVPPRGAHFVTGLTRFRGEEPPKRIMENYMKKHLDVKKVII